MNPLIINNAKQKIIKLELNDIYSGEEQIKFNNRHPIYKSLMKIEFEEVLRRFLRK